MKVQLTLDLSKDEREDLISTIASNVAGQIDNKVFHHESIQAAVKETSELLKSTRLKRVKKIVDMGDEAARKEFVKDISSLIYSDVSRVIMYDSKFINLVADEVIKKLEKLKVN